MTSLLTETEINLFSKELPSLDEIGERASLVNSSEYNQLQFADQIESNSSNSLAAGIGLVIIGEYEKAAESLSKAGSDSIGNLYLGIALRGAGEFGKAVKAFDKAGKDLDGLVIALEKSETYRLAEQLDEAESELKGCANFENASAEYHFQVGKVLNARGEYEAALDNFVTSVEIDEKHEKSLFELAFANDLRGDEETAIEYYKQVTKHAPVKINAMLNLAVLYEDAGDFDKAHQLAFAVVDAFPNHKKANLFKKDIQSSMVMIYDEEKEKWLDRHNRILEIPISDFELSVRSRNCLKKMNINTLGDLLRISESELLSYKNFGETSLTEIKKILNQKQLSLGIASDLSSSGLPMLNQDLSGVNEEMLGKTINDLELSVRAKRALGKLGVINVSELVSKTEAELLGCKNFGVTSLNEIKERLTGFGLSLRKLE